MGGKARFGTVCRPKRALLFLETEEALFRVLDLGVGAACPGGGGGGGIVDAEAAVFVRPKQAVVALLRPFAIRAFAGSAAAEIHDDKAA